MNKFFKLTKVLFTLVFTISCYSLSSQHYQIKDIKTAMSRGACFAATLSINNTSVLSSNQNKIYNGRLAKIDEHSAFAVAAYPQGQNPSAANKVGITTFSRSGGHQEISVTRNGKTKVFYPNEIKSSRDDYGYHFVLGNSGGNIIDQLVGEQIRIDIAETPCNGAHAPPSQPQQPTIIYQQVPVPVANSNEGCSDLQDALASISKKMYPRRFDEDKASAWLKDVSKKIFDAPQGCIGRADEVEKLYWVAKSLYPKHFDDDERNSWAKNMINTSLRNISKYKRKNWAKEWDELVQESKEIFDWHKEDERVEWVSKKINRMYNQ